MAGRRYAITGNYGSVNSAQDILRITAPTTSIMRLISLHVTQDTEESSEMLPFSIYKATNDGNGSAATITNLDDGDSAPGSLSAVYNLSSIATGKTGPIYREAQNILAGFHHVPVPEERITVRAGGRVVCRLETAPTAILTLSVNAVVEVEG